MPPTTIVYDGECPFCRRYVRLINLRKAVGPVNLIDARRLQDSPEVSEIRRRGLIIDEGMVLILDGNFYHGADSINRIALLSSSSNFFNRLNRFVFSSKSLSKLLYPILRASRNLTIKLLRRGKLGY